MLRTALYLMAGRTKYLQPRQPVLVGLGKVTVQRLDVIDLVAIFVAELASPPVPLKRPMPQP